MFGWAIIIVIVLVLVLVGSAAGSRLYVVLNGFFALLGIGLIVLSLAAAGRMPEPIFWIWYPAAWVVVCGGLRALQYVRRGE
jgi:hypothetical protein